MGLAALGDRGAKQQRLSRCGHRQESQRGLRVVWKQGSDRTSLLSLIVIDRETGPSPAHHSSECKHLVDILCKQHSLLRRSSFSVNTDLCNLAQHCSVRFKPQEQANRKLCAAGVKVAL